MSDDSDGQDFSSGMAAFEAKNFSQAMQFLSPLAEAGNADAQHRVAIMCQNGLGVVRNETRACNDAGRCRAGLCDRAARSRFYVPGR